MSNAYSGVCKMMTKKNMTASIGWLVLTLLMLGMSWSAAVSPATDVAMDSDEVGTVDETLDPLALPENDVPVGEQGFDPSAELLGSRTESAKTYLGEDGERTTLLNAGPIHYLEDGVWEDIDLNIVSNADGWEVTKNTFETKFSSDEGQGISVQAHENVDPIRFGINPMAMWYMGEDFNPMPYLDNPSQEPVEVGANVIRYPLSDNAEVDYMVSQVGVKQTLNIREMPQIHDGFEGYFGIQETMILPSGFALFINDAMVEDGKLVTTSESIDIRNIETGERLAVLDRPLMFDMNTLTNPNPDEPDGHLGLYIIRAFGEVIEIATVVDTEWLLSEERVYPVQIDPSLNVRDQKTGYAYYYRVSYGWSSYTYQRAYANSRYNSLTTCQGRGSTQSCTTSSSYNWYYRYTWYRFDFANALPTGATVTDADFISHTGRYRAGSANFQAVVVKSGTSQSSNMIDANSYLCGWSCSYGSNLARFIRQSAASSATTTLSDPNYYWYGFYSRTISLSTNGVSDVQDAVDGNAAGTSGNILTLGLRNTNNEPYWYWCGHTTYSYCNSASELPKMAITYTGGSDTSPPIANFAPYDGVTSYREDARTFYIGLTDGSGVDTTSSQGPRLYYRVNNGTYTQVAASTVGTCVSGSECTFKAQIPAVNLGDYVQYFWAYRDLSTTGPNNGPNTGTTPAGGTGTPSAINSGAISPYDYFVQDVEDATAGVKKSQIKVDGQSNYFYYQARQFFSYQVTMWENNYEYMIELDTSTCGTGANSCFKTSGLVWNGKYIGTAASTYTTSSSVNAKVASVPGLTFAADDGPGMNLMYYWDSSTSSMGVLGLGTSTGIEEAVSGGTTYTGFSAGSSDDGYVRVPIPADYTGNFGGIPLNGTTSPYYSSSARNLVCIGTNGYFYFVRGNPAYCTTWFSTSYKFNGFNVGATDTRFNAAGHTITAKASNIRPTPDIWAPSPDHDGLMDSYTEEDRTVKFEMSDAGDPPSGIDITSGSDANGDLYRPFMKYRTNDIVNGTGWSSWAVRALTPSGGYAFCEMGTCDWSGAIPGTERGNAVEYTIHVRDNEGNMLNSSAYSYDLVTPTKVMTIEWHDQNCGFGSQYACSWQVKLYDVSNEIEFHYDTGSQMYYDYETVGYQSPNGAEGDTILSRGQGYQSGYTPSRWTNNYRIATDGSSHGYESFTAGMTELFNYDEVFTGTSNGRPYTYYCTRYWSSYRNQCSEVIDIPADFDFEYFGNTYSGNSGHKIHAIRHGAMQFSTSSSSNSAQMMYYGWSTTMPDLPSTSSYVNNVDLAPWWGYYASYYCYYDNSNECSIRTKTIPFNGAGTDVAADINTPTIWDLEMSPIRITPANGDYITVNADLTIESGVTVEIAENKGIVFNGACNKLTVNGTADLPVNITDLGTTSAKALGMAFTNGCTTSGGTDDRHTFTHTNFENMSVAISAGSAWGSTPRYNGNVGDFEMSDMTFDNVDKAISHGSGQGTSFTMENFAITNAADACMDLPQDAVVDLRFGSMDECNTNWNDWGGAIVNYPGSNGGSLTMENVTITDARANGISVDYDALWLSNVSLTIPDLTNDAGRPGTNWNPDGGVYHDADSTSGSTFYGYGLTIDGYYRGVYTQATDSVHMEEIAGTGLEGFISVIPAGASSSVTGATGADAVFDDITMSGSSNSDSQLYLERTRPDTINDVSFTTSGNGPGLYLAGNSPDSGTVTVTGYEGAHMRAVGCGWTVEASTVSIDTDSTAVISNCASSSSSNRVTVSGFDLDYTGTGSSTGASYAQNSILTMADGTIDSDFSNIGSAGLDGSVRMIGITYGTTECITSSTAYSQTTCPADVLHPNGEAFVGGMATVGVFRVINQVPTYVGDHRVTTTVVTTSGTCPDLSNSGLCTVNDIAVVGSASTNGNGLAEAWLITNRLGYSSTGTTVTNTYTDHSFNIGGGAGQNTTSPADAWYTTDYNDAQHDLPMTIGSRADFQLEAYPMDWNGATVDCTWLANNDSASLTGGYYTYTLQIVTLSTDLVLDGCNLHLNGTKMSVNSTGSTSDPTITLRNGAQLYLTGGVQSGGVDGYIKAVTSLYGWKINIEGGTFDMDHSFIRDMYQDTTTNSGVYLGAGATMNMLNGSYAMGSYATSPSMATIKVAGGKLIMDDARVSNNQQTGVGVHLEQTSSSVLDDITIENAATGIVVRNGAPTVNDFTLSNNDVGVENYGGMALPTIYRSPLLQGQSGWQTHEIDITNFAKDDEVLQMAFNSVYAGGNAHPYNYYSSHYYMIYDRMRIYADTGDGNGLELIDYGHNMVLNTDAATNYGEPPVWDCNAYGYEYNPGGSYQYAYYGYMLNYGPSQLQQNGSYNNPPLNYGFRTVSAPGLTTNTNYYPYHYMAGYWPANYYPATYPVTPEVLEGGSGGMWGYYGVCQDYAYRFGTPNPSGFRHEFPPISTPGDSYVEVVLKMDVYHNRNNYFQDRVDFLTRGGADHTSMGDWQREFGVASLSNGEITGSETGVKITGGTAAGSYDNLNIIDPTDEGILFDGSNNINFNDVTVTDGRYATRMTSSATGKTAITNANFDGQTQSALVLTGDMGLAFGGVINNSATSGIHVPSSSTKDWSFDSLTISNSTLGLQHDGTGNVRMVESVMSLNTNDIEIGEGSVTFIEGDIGTGSGVSVDGGGVFTRARFYDVTLEADSSSVNGALAKLIDADGRAVDEGKSDSSGLVDNLEFVAYTINAGGTNTMNLAGMQVASVYKHAAYEYRYALETVTLTDDPGNADTVDMADQIDAHVCYRYNGNYGLSACSSSVGYGGSWTAPSGLKQYDAYYAMSGEQNNMAILMDNSYNYMDAAAATYFNNTIIFTTGYDSNNLASIRVEYPYTQKVSMDDTTVIGMGEASNDNPGGFYLGYSGTSNYGAWDVNNTKLIGIASAGSGKGYYGAPSIFEITNSTLSHYTAPMKTSSFYYYQICITTAGIDDVVIENNKFFDCDAGVMIPYNYYAYSSYYGGTGTDDMVVKDNVFTDTGSIGFWFYLNTLADDVLIEGNTITGSTSPSYGVYIQDATTNSVDVVGNDIKADVGFYSRNGKQWDVDGNTFRGIGDDAFPGVYVQSGWGTITDNTLIDADGGISVYGIRGANDVHIQDNDVSFSTGRVPTSALGISVSNCGSTSEVLMGGNDVEVISNALVTNGCTVFDEGSSFTSLGGAAPRVHPVDIRASTFSPQHLSINLGDTVRWHATSYYNDPSCYMHSTTANSSAGNPPEWDSGMMNNGTYFSHTFNTAGTYEYHSDNCAVTMWGSITVATTSGPTLASTGINVAGSGDDVSLSNTSISGFGIGISMEGGDLYLGGSPQVRSGSGALIVADRAGIQAEDVDITINGATIEVDDTTGVGVDAVSTGGVTLLDITDLSTDGGVGVLADGHKLFRWNGGTSASDVTLKTLNAATGSIENMSWANTGTQINAGPFSTITSVGNGVLNPAKLTLTTTSIIHEGNLLDLDVTHMGSAATDVGVVIRSTEDFNTATGGAIPLVGHSRAEYVSPSWRTRAGATIVADGDMGDWVGEYTASTNIADDMMPGEVAVNVTTGAGMRVTWDSSNMYIGLSGVTFTASDGLIYLDTVAGGSSTGDNWYVSHNLPFQADFMLFAEDATSWGIKRVTPTGNWVDVTSSCTGIQSFVGFGYPGFTPTFNLNSEFAIPWSCIGSPTEDVRWLAIVQNENSGHVLGMYPPQMWDAANATAQNFYDFGNFDLGGVDLPDGSMDDFLLIFRTYAGTTTPTPPRPYDIIVKVRDADNDYWDWGTETNVMMSTNQEVEIDIKRAKPVIQNLVDVTVDEDTGLTSITMTDKADDYQDQEASLTWEIVDSAANTHTFITPYSYVLNGHSLDVTTLQDQFGGHRLKATVTDSDGLNATQTFHWNVTNVNDKPVMCNTARSDCVLMVYDGGSAETFNIRDEQAVDGSTGFTIPRSLGSVYNVSGSYIIDMANENTQTDNNPYAVPQTYVWSANEGDDCVPFSVEMSSTTDLLLTENATNENGGMCTIVFGLSDGVDSADNESIDFIVNPINDAPVIPNFDASTGAVIEVANGDILYQGDENDWYFELTEDDTNVDNLTFNLANMMSDIDHQTADYQWEVAKTAMCDYDHYFTIAFDQDTEDMSITLIPDATTTAPTSEIDFLQDADGDGVRDGGIHQIVPASGYYCTVSLWLNDTAEAPSYINYSQAGYDTYDQRSDRVTLNIRVNNVAEARPDYHFDTDFGFSAGNDDNIDAVLPGTRVPFTVKVTNNGDDPTLYNYGHDLQIRFTANDNPGIQHQVTLEWDDGEVPGIGETVDVKGYITMNTATDEVAVFSEVRTIDPFTDAYVTDNFRRPALEELNWANNNMTTTDTGDALPKMVGLRPASSVASFVPGLMAVSMVGLFLGLTLFSARREEDEIEMVEELSSDEEAVSPVIATILLVAITVVLSGTIYVWSSSLADTSGKAAPRVTALTDTFVTSDDPNDWAWKITVNGAQNELATQAVRVQLEWTDSNGEEQFRDYNMTDKYVGADSCVSSGSGDATGDCGLYGRNPSNSDAMVTFKDDIDCSAAGDCTTGFGAGDIIYVLMHDPSTGEIINSMGISVIYAPGTQAATPLMSFTGQTNPPRLAA